MNDCYDDSDEYSSANSFRARSNTWPLNRPDLAAPSSGICIDEPLPEIELEEDDLFTTNENWSTGLVDHDIMSWDPILNAQSQQQVAVVAPTNHHQPSTIHHHHHQQQQQPTHEQHVQQPTPHPQQQHQQHGHQRQQSIHLHHHQPQSVPVSASAQAPQPQQPHHQEQSQHHQHSHHRHQQPHQQHHHTTQQQQQTHHQQQQQMQPQQLPNHHLPPQPSLAPTHQQSHEPLLAATNAGAVLLNTNAAGQVQHRHQPPHHHQPQPQQHQTLNSSHCLEPDDTNEYHIQQLHHLHLDNNPQTTPTEPHQQTHYVSSLSSMCIRSSTANDSYNISSDHHNHHNHHSQHHLQPLTSARYDLEQHNNDYDLKAPLDDEGLQGQGQHHLTHHQLHHQQPHHNHHHHHHLDQQQTHHQLHHMTSSSLDNHSIGSHLLSSSLSTSGIGLSGDLEDLDYKGLDPSTILQNPHFEEHEHEQQQDQQQSDPLQQQSQQQSEACASETKQSNSTSTSKTKLNTPRRNAWGNMSYADLISQAINSTSDKRLTLSQIYDWMVQHVPYFKDKGDSNSSAGWKNSVRHNLSLHSRFKRLQNEGTGKSSWWTINPEANIGKCARRRAASMEASKYEKKRGRAKKRAEAIRQGLVSYPSLTNSSLNGSTTTLEQSQPQAQSLNQFQDPQQKAQSLDQFGNNQQPPIAAAVIVSTSTAQPLPPLSVVAAAAPQQAPSSHQQTQITSLDHQNLDQPSQQQQQHLQQLQRADGRSLGSLHDQSQYEAAPLEQQYEDSKNDKMQQQHQQQQQSQYYYQQFELSTAL